MISNEDFLKAIFGNQYKKAHVTSFETPPEDSTRLDWSGGYFGDYDMQEGNQYFTISTFFPDSEGIARRRKALFKATYVITLDDVKEKLPLDQVKKLPEPSYILETSAGSEQWGYILSEPETDRTRVDNVLDGLVSKGLAPDGNDPGMKGVTRYVRLPEGTNTKRKRNMFKCKLLEFNPFNTVTIEELCKPFDIDPDAVRADQRVEGAAEVTDHPLVNDSGLNIKSILSPGRYDITCPWVDEHTGAEDDGTCVFTNEDLSIGYACHHGHCQGRTAKDLLDHLGKDFKIKLKTYQVSKGFEGVEFNKDLLEELKKSEPFSKEQRDNCIEYLISISDVPAIDKINLYNEVQDLMGWNKSDLTAVLKDLKPSDKVSSVKFENCYFVSELNQVYNKQKNIFHTMEAFHNSYAHLDPEARKTALQNSGVIKLDKIKYSPGRDRVYSEKGVEYFNSWSNDTEHDGVKGDVTPWLNHFDIMGWGSYRNHVVKYLAFTLQKPEIKINHAIILGGLEGSGKDFLITAMRKALGNNYSTINGEDMLCERSDYLIDKKYIHINEVELGSDKLSLKAAIKIKPLCAAPPFTFRARKLYSNAVDIDNIFSIVMTTNSSTPLRLQSNSRRIMALWSDLDVRDGDGNMAESWAEYFNDLWAWFDNGGEDAIIYYLRNIDVSDFQPALAPPVTEFLRNMVENGKDSLLQTIEAFYRHRVACFGRSEATLDEITKTLKQGASIAPHLMYIDEKHISPARVGNTMARARIGESFTVDGVKLWRFKSE